MTLNADSSDLEILINISFRFETGEITDCSLFYRLFKPSLSEQYLPYNIKPGASAPYSISISCLTNCIPLLRLAIIW